MPVKSTGNTYVERLYLNLNLEDEKIKPSKYFGKAFYASGTANTRLAKCPLHFFCKMALVALSCL